MHYRMDNFCFNSSAKLGVLVVGEEDEVMPHDSQSPSQAVMTLAKILHPLCNLLRPDGTGCFWVINGLRSHNLKSQISGLKKLLGRME